MKNLSIFIILASLLFSACSEKLVEQNLTVTLPDLTVTIEEGLTRTYVTGTTLYWHADDQISVFYGSTVNSQYEFDGENGVRSGTFSFVSGSESSSEFPSAVRAVYPYQEDATIADNGTISLELPSMQQYSAKSFGKGANTMIGVSEDMNPNYITFKNACGYLKLKLYDGNTNDGNIVVKSITVKGNNDEKIAGAATATIGNDGVPSLTMSETARKSVTIDCGSGVTLGTTSDAATEFWFVLPVITFEDGISIIVTTTDNDIYEKSTSNTVSITRNEIQPMATLELKNEMLMSKGEEIRYTSTGSIVEPTGFSEGSIYSNTYVNGQGVITFHSDVTSIPVNAFINCTTLKSIFIPAGVESIGNNAFSGCTALTTVYCLATTPPDINLPATIFDSEYISNLKIYVPAGSIDSYKDENNSDWYAYAEYIYPF